MTTVSRDGARTRETTRGLAIGWDVGGWLGKKQAVAVIEVGDDQTWRHAGTPASFTLQDLAHLTVLDLIRTAWPEAPLNVLDGRTVVIAIDAPLSFPTAFLRLLAGKVQERPSSANEIDNRLAYRDCDRYVHAEHGKKPLSASFDKLGNNATVAIVLTRQWRRNDGFVVLPFDEPAHPRREIIEAYPALVKRDRGPVPQIRALLPVELEDGSDRQDAAICALVALAHLGVGDPLLPPIVAPVGEQGSDGWIYAPPVEWIRGGGSSTPRPHGS